MAVVTMSQLLEAGVHFGHQTKRWNPKMKRYILTDRNSIYIIDLRLTLAEIDKTYDYVKETVARGGNILFVGTKKQAQSAIKEQAERTGMPYVNHRWLGGMLTNFQTVSKRIARMKELEEIDFDDVAGSKNTKKELLMMSREKEKLERTLGGLRDMRHVPTSIFVVDTPKEHLAVAEANKLGIPVVAILDTNCDPDEVQYPIPGNDDSIGSVQLLTRIVGDAVAEGLLARGGNNNEAMPEWERDVLESSKDASADAAAETATPEAAASEAEAAPGAVSSEAPEAAAESTEA
ncbi:30S ribosomal protein S2 [Neoactinobaculum massilliense]|uniref:30S ribosomal protein S2 n=1 Tax=Neoactinobaculum massilliense TaxID=2364794 RepID=UPI000F53419C|nr:30S ribosomal protein S2 [Neoactinobaculum massilliense]